MNEADIRRYAELMKELDLTGLEITDAQDKVRLERSAPSSTRQMVYSVSENKENIPSKPINKNCISVKSPIVGVFYAAPAENAKSYVSIGDSVKKGQILCIVEAMKLMNEITAEEEGVISKICVTDGQVVEYGTELFQIER